MIEPGTKFRISRWKEQSSDEPRRSEGWHGGSGKASNKTSRIRHYPSTKMSRNGFSLAEILLSMGFFATAILSIIGLSLSIMRTDSKALETSAGTLIADQVAQRLLSQLKADSPAGTRADFMDNEFVVNEWDEGSLKNENTEFFYTVHASTVINVTTGAPLGSSLAGNRLKKVDIHVWWAGQNSQERQGSGRLEVRMSKLVSEADLAAATP